MNLAAKNQELGQFEALSWALEIAKNRDASEVVYEIEQMMYRISKGEKPDFPWMAGELERIRGDTNE